VTAEVHPSAVVDPSARLAPGVRVGAHAVIGPEVEIGEGTEVGAGAQLRGPATIGAGNRIFPYACIGFDPQDLKFAGERTAVRIGDRNHFREFCTVHRGTGKGGGLTAIGSDNLFMVYSHVAHDCRVGSRTIFSNNATLAGHVEVGDDAVIGAFSAVHQFCRVGRHCYIGGFSVITKDALPYLKVVGHKPANYGLNRIGLLRKGLSREVIARLDAAFDVLLRSGRNTSQALALLRAEHCGEEAVDYLVEFVAGSQRGVIKALPGRRGARGAGGAADDDAAADAAAEG
jgi:UDP-N-acetylglucosamine acyltransferase